MKSIKKITNKVTNNVSSLAGSALLVGATLTGGAAFAASQSGSSGSSMDLGDYPQPFVTEDGEIDTSIVIGSDASTIDVVGATEIAGSLGMNAFGEETVSVSGSGVAASWSADNGVTLNRQNSNLFLNDATDAEQTSLDEADLNILDTTTFQSEDNEEVEIEHEVNVGQQNQNFNPAGDNDDPLLHVQNPQNPDASDTGHLFSATVELSDTIDFTEAGTNNPDGPQGDADEWIEDGDEIELFGTEYTFSDESSQSELVLYGSSDRVEVNTGESTTITVDGEELQLESTYVSEDGTSATVVVGGQTENVEEGDSVGPDGNVRISDIYRTGPDGQGRVAFSQGSDELVINYGDTGAGNSLGDVEVDGDDVDGVSVAVDGDTGGTGFQETDGMTFYFGGTDSDENYVAAGETYEDPLFGALEFHYGGLSGDVEENPAEEIEVNAAEDGEATVTLNQGEDSRDVVFATNDQTGTTDATTPNELSVDDGEYIATFEGERLEEDDYVVLNANEDAGMYQVTSLTEEVSSIDGGSEGEVSVTLENAVTGNSVEIDEDGIQESDLSDVDGGTDNGYTLDSESVEGKDFDITFHEGGEVSLVRTGESSIQVFPTLYTESDAAMAFTEDQEQTGASFANVNADLSGSDGDLLYEQTIELPSTAISSENTATIRAYDNGQNGTEIEIAGHNQTMATDSDNSVEAEFTAGEQVYSVTVQNQNQTAQASGDGDTTSSVVELSHHAAVDANQNYQGTTVSGALGPSVAVIQPEDDEDEEHGFFFTPDVSDDDSGDIAPTYSGQTPSSGFDGNVPENAWLRDDLDSEDDMTVGYTDYGAYTEHDTDDDEMFTLSLPSGQSTAGMAVTGTDGGLSSSGAGGGSAMAATPTYEMADGVLDSDGNVNQVKNNENVIVVGGPNANSLTQELVDDNQTMPASEYTEGQGMIQMVDGWSDGNSALVVAGYQGEDTRAAAQFLADYRNNQEDLEGQSEVTIETSSGSVVSN
jgi:hypothetical protein